ncbi:MAG: hypothetical protein L0H78_16595 [Humibacillus sp.]|nr:hypothetical protein [Humibacillus sp.]
MMMMLFSACSSTLGSGEVAASGDGLDSSSLLSHEQLMNLRRDDLKRAASAQGIASPPEVALVRWTDLTNYAPTVVKCLEDAGFTATAVGGGGLELGEVPKSQDKALGLASYMCAAKYTIHPYYNLPPSKTVLTKMYAWYTEVSAPCLRAQGIDVPEPPTQDTWVEEYSTSQPSWLPWHSVPGPNSANPSTTGWDELERKCPQNPAPDAYLEHAPAIDHQN